MKLIKVERYYNRVRDFSIELTKPFFTPDFDFTNQGLKKIAVASLSENLVRTQLTMTPWYMPWRKSFLKLVVIHALQERVQVLNEFNRYNNQK